MTIVLARRFASVFGAIVVVGWCGCHEGEIGRGVGAACDETTVCREPYVCDYGRCRSSCSIDSDCPGGACVQSASDANAWVCTVAAEQGCKSSGCPKGLYCGADDVCRTGCDVSHPCKGSRACVEGTCFDRLADGGVPSFDSSADVADVMVEAEAGTLAEKWLVSSVAAKKWTVYLTDRDCENPVVLCQAKDCGNDAAFSPAGDRVVIAQNCPEWTSLCDLGIIDLSDSSHTFQPLGVKGIGAFWATDDEIYYKATLSSTWCNGEHNQIRKHTVSTHQDVLLADNVGRTTDRIVVDPSQSHIVWAEEVPNACWTDNMRIKILGVGGTIEEPTWSADGNSDDPFALLPGGVGFLEQVETGHQAPRSIYKVLWDGPRQSVYSGMTDANMGLCGAPRRISASGEFYCGGGSGIHRLNLSGTTPTKVQCGLPGELYVRDVGLVSGSPPDGGTPKDAAEDQKAEGGADAPADQSTDVPADDAVNDQKAEGGADAPADQSTDVPADTQPGSPEKMIYYKGPAPFSIYYANTDGTGETLIADKVAQGNDGPVGYGGGKICYSTGTAVVVMNWDGSSPQTVPNTTDVASSVDCAPDGSKVVYAGGASNFKLFVVATDGSGKVTFNDASVGSKHQTAPSWNAAGSIVFGQASFGDPTDEALYWKPDDQPASAPQVLAPVSSQYPETGGPGGLIAYNDQPGKLHVMNADGSNVLALSAAGTENVGKKAWSKATGALFFRNKGDIWRINSDNTGYAKVLTDGNVAGVVGVTSSAANTDFTWTLKAPLNPARANGAAAVVNDRLYAINGFDGSPGTCRAVQVYDPSTNQWITKASYTRSEGRWTQGAAAIGTDIYVVGGVNCMGNYVTNTVDKYDTVNDTWTLDVTTYPNSLGDVECIGVSGSVYCFGGREYNGPDHKEAYKYTPGGTGFTSVAEVPSPRGNALALVLGTKVYLVGGYQGGTFLDRVDIYDTLLDTWSSAAKTPSPGYERGGGVIGGRLYVAGGYNGTLVDESFEYDPIQDKWRTLLPLPAPRTAGFVGTINKKLYYAGGSTTGGGHVSTLYEGALTP